MKLKGLVLLIFILVVLLLAGFIGAQNDHLVLVNYLLAETQVSMSTVLSITFLFGFVVCFTLFLLILLRMKWRIAALERKNKKLAQVVPAE